MTLKQWLKLDVGDVVIDTLHRHVKRKVLAVHRHPPDGRNLDRTRTIIRVASLKSAGATTLFFDTADPGVVRRGGGTRFRLYSKRRRRRKAVKPLDHAPTS